MLADLDPKQRLHLMKFVCSFAWADLVVHPAESSFAARLMSHLDLDEAAQLQVDEWLKSPPTVDPTSIPREHSAVYLAAIDGVIAADGEVAPEERENLMLLKSILRERDAS